MANAFGYLAIGFVLGWAALFLSGTSWRTRAAQLLWVATLVLWTAISDHPPPTAVAIGLGALLHFTFQQAIRERIA